MAITRARVILASTALVLLAGVSLYAYNATEQFLIRDPRFHIATPDSAQPFLQVTGVHHSSIRAIEAVFAADAGQSLYLVPIEERLASLRTIFWVGDASVARVWPNRLLVQVFEREPVAFARMQSSKVSLIDAEGVLLPPVRDQFNLPVIIGIKPADDLATRQAAVQRMLRASSDLGESVMKDVSEIDVSDSENLAITVPHNGALVKLQLGDRDYAARYQTFVRHSSEIDAKAPGARVVDLRLDDRFTVVEEE